MGPGRGRSGIRRWRLHLRRTVHESPSDPSRERGDRAAGDGAGSPIAGGGGNGSGSGAGGTGQASLDQVLRRAAAVRAERHDEEG